MAPLAGVVLFPGGRVGQIKVSIKQPVAILMGSEVPTESYVCFVCVLSKSKFQGLLPYPLQMALLSWEQCFCFLTSYPRHKKKRLFQVILCNYLLQRLAESLFAETAHLLKKKMTWVSTQYKERRKVFCQPWNTQGLSVYDSTFLWNIILISGPLNSFSREPT